MMAMVNYAARLVIRTVIIVLMTLVAAVPALAELGCFEATATQSTTTMAAAEFSIINERHDDDEQSRAGGLAHCASSHCVHGVPAAPPKQDASPSDFPAAAYSRPETHRLLNAAPEGPDHPPRA